jgi:tRNA(Arg) A34 adenosine deaminase TadA
MFSHETCIALPPWVDAAVDGAAICSQDDDKMALAIRLAALNVEHGLGGPFGAAVFEQQSGRLVAVGVNRVLEHRCSVAHAEIVAIMLAEATLGCHTLAAGPARHYVLATSAQPCAMCYGALGWSGISRLLIGARREDVESITGFDEGPLPADWQAELERRGIAVVRDLLREAACAPLRRYRAAGGMVY